MDVVERSLAYLSLFAGIGGLDFGVRLALPATRCLGYVEVEAFNAAILAARMEDGSLDSAPVWSDVRTFPSSLYRGHIDMVVGGFPCQDLSVAGQRAGIVEGNRSSLFFDLIRTADDVGCRYLILENVAGIYVRPNLDVVLGTLAAGGWDAEWLSLRASDVAAPHKRERWFCVARRVADGASGSGTEQSGITDTGGSLVSTGIRADGRTSDREPSKGIPQRRGINAAGTARLRGVLEYTSGERRQQDTRSAHADESTDAGRTEEDDHQFAGADTGVADSPLRRRGVERTAAQPGCGGHADGGECAVADAGRAVSGRAALTERGGTDSDPERRTGGPVAPAIEYFGCGDALADAAGTEPSERRSIGSGVREERSTASGCGESLADTSIGFLSESGRRPQGRDGTGPTIPLFPPGPGERDEWAAILAARPDLAPALKPTVRGMADGTAAELDYPLIYRTDRLRSLGNGVVPLQAAVAISELWRRMHGG